MLVGRKAQLPEAFHDVPLHSVRRPSPCRRRRPRIIEVPLSQRGPLYGQKEDHESQDRAPNVGCLEPQLARCRPSPSETHKRRNGRNQQGERQVLERVADLAKGSDNPQKKRPRQRSLSPFVVIAFDHARFFFPRGVSPPRCVIVLRDECPRPFSDDLSRYALFPLTFAQRNRVANQR